MKNENYVLIQGWMINELHLKGNEAIVYAVIYGFSQDEDCRFVGGLQYLADWCGLTKRGVANVINGLEKKGLIERNEEVVCGVKMPSFSAKVNFFPEGVKSFPEGVKSFPEKMKSFPEKMKSFPEKMKSFPPDSNIYIGKNNVSIDNKEGVLLTDVNNPPKKDEQEEQPKSQSDDFAKSVMDGWNRISKRYGLPKIIGLTAERKKKFKNILKVFGLSGVEEFCKIVDEAVLCSEFLRGVKSKWNENTHEYDVERMNWRADFDFFLREDKFRKVCEDGYDSGDVVRYKQTGKWEEGMRRLWLKDLGLEE